MVIRNEFVEREWLLLFGWAAGLYICFIAANLKILIDFLREMLQKELVGAFVRLILRVECRIIRLCM